jgi:hypothetical protein
MRRGRPLGPDAQMREVDATARADSARALVVVVVDRGRILLTFSQTRLDSFLVLLLLFVSQLKWYLIAFVRLE